LGDSPPGRLPWTGPRFEEDEGLAFLVDTIDVPAPANRMGKEHTADAKFACTQVDLSFQIVFVILEYLPIDFFLQTLHYFWSILFINI
jgi:hypothetical protein